MRPMARGGLPNREHSERRREGSGVMAGGWREDEKAGVVGGAISTSAD